MVEQSADIFEEEVARFVVFEVGKHVTGHCRSDVVCLLEEVVTSEKLKPGPGGQFTLLWFAPLNDWQGGPGRMISKK